MAKSEVTGQEPSAMAIAGTSDTAASWKIMRDRISPVKSSGTGSEILVLKGLHPALLTGIKLTKMQ